MTFPTVVFVRDLILALLCLVGWFQITENNHISLHVLLALLSTLIAFFAHEWGHYFAGRFYGAKLKPSNKMNTLFLFKIIKLSSIKSFVALSLGGYLASIIMVLLFVFLLPKGLWSTIITLALTAVGVVVTLFLEVPELIRVLKTKKFPNGFAYTDEEG